MKHIKYVFWLSLAIGSFMVLSPAWAQDFKAQGGTQLAFLDSQDWSFLPPPQPCEHSCLSTKSWHKKSCANQTDEVSCLQQDKKKKCYWGCP